MAELRSADAIRDDRRKVRAHGTFDRGGVPSTERLIGDIEPLLEELDRLRAENTELRAENANLRESAETATFVANNMRESWQTEVERREDANLHLSAAREEAANLRRQLLDETYRPEGGEIVMRELGATKRDRDKARDALRKIRHHVNEAECSDSLAALIRQTVHDGLGE